MTTLPHAASNAKPIDIRGFLLAGTMGLVGFLGKLAIALFLALFLLSSGNSFRRKMMKRPGPKLSQRKVTIETLDEITEQIQRYLLVHWQSALWWAWSRGSSSLG